VDFVVDAVGSVPLLALAHDVRAIYLDNMERPILNAHVNLAELLSLDEGKVWVGLTAATGRRFQAHDIYTFTSTPSEPAQQ
jgi:hypothetical protein